MTLTERQPRRRRPPAKGDAMTDFDRAVNEFVAQFAQTPSEEHAIREAFAELLAMSSRLERALEVAIDVAIECGATQSRLKRIVDELKPQGALPVAKVVQR